MSIRKWIINLFCFPFSDRIKGNKRLKNESQAVYKARRKSENKLTAAYTRGEIYKTGRIK